MINGDYWINGLKVTYAGASDPGLARSCNEDSLLLLPEAGLDAGDLASTTILDLLRNSLHARLRHHRV